MFRAGVESAAACLCNGVVRDSDEKLLELNLVEQRHDVPLEYGLLRHVLLENGRDVAVAAPVAL